MQYWKLGRTESGKLNKKSRMTSGPQLLKHGTAGTQQQSKHRHCIPLLPDVPGSSWAFGIADELISACFLGMAPATVRLFPAQVYLSLTSSWVCFWSVPCNQGKQSRALGSAGKGKVRIRGGLQGKRKAARIAHFQSTRAGEVLLP